MADREAAGIELGEQRLDVAQDGVAGGGVAHVADRHGAGQAVDDLAPREGVADEAEAALGVEALAVVADDAGGLLAAVLQGVQAERGDGGGVGVSVDAEHAAFLAQPVAVELEVERPEIALADPEGVGIAAIGTALGGSVCIVSPSRLRRRWARRTKPFARESAAKPYAQYGPGARRPGPDSLVFVRRVLALRRASSSASSRWCSRGPPATAP